MLGQLTKLKRVQELLVRTETSRTRDGQERES